jgi:glycosyltransferase involved in cell wall biosynthesis
MLTGQNLIYFAPENWDGLWRNRQQLMAIFARHNKVLFVEPRRHLKPTLARFRSGELRLADLNHSLLNHLMDNLYLFCYPVWAPISGRFPLDSLTQSVRRRSIAWAMQQLDMAEPIVWFSRPSMIDLLDEMPCPQRVIYHVVDEYSAYGGQFAEEKRLTIALEEQMLARADMVVVVSQNLYDTKSPSNPNTYLVPNGVNYQAYARALADDWLPESIRTIPRPRLGYSGLIGDRLDLGMLKSMAQAHPEWSLVFLGEARVPNQEAIWQVILTMPNVHYLGKVDISEVPYYLKGFDMGLMPYAQSREADNISPLKLYDYLAAGLPVASTDIPAARQFTPYIHLAQTSQDFMQAVELALADTTHERVQERKQVAQAHTWEARVEQLSDLIEKQSAQA